MPWFPTSRTELLGLLEHQLSHLDTKCRETFDRYSVDLEIISRVFDANASNPVTSFVIARDGSRVLFYDDIEEEFGTGTVAADGQLHQWGTWGEQLSWALMNFPNDRGTSLGPAQAILSR